MKILTLLCLALVTGNILLAQQPAEWRPNVAEDNKAATWEDTSAFVVNSLAAYSGGMLSAKTTARCQLTIAGNTISDPLGVTISVFNEHLLQFASVRPGSFAESIGLRPGMKLIGIGVNGEAKHDPQGLRIRKVADFEAFESALKPGDHISMVVEPENLEQEIRTNPHIKTRNPNEKGGIGLYGEIDGTLTTATTPGYIIDFSKVDPLSIVLRGNDISLSGTMNAEFAASASAVGGDSTAITHPINLSITDADMAKRIGRALMHAALLCGGTKAVSPF